MNKTILILKSELITTLKRKGFFITTLAIPLLGLLAILIFHLVSNLTQSTPAETIRIGYVDQTGIFTQYTAQGNIELVPYSTPEEAKAALLAKDIRDYLVIPQDYLAGGFITRYSLKTDIEVPSGIRSAISSFLVSNLLRDKVDPAVASRIMYPLALASFTLDQSGHVVEGRGGYGTWLISYLFSILLLISIFTASGYLLQGLSEEKENRIMEILLSSVSTRELITGKVLGLGIAGLVQMVIWLLSFWGLLHLASGSIGGIFSGLEFPPSVMVLGVVYFILGYFLYAILMAGTGAIAPTVREGQQMSVFFSLLAAIPYFLITLILEGGDSLVNIVLTILPFTSPLTVMMRLWAGVPAWELGVSIAVLMLSIYGFLLLAARVFRIYLLMYGKTPSWREIIRSLRQA